MKKYFLFAMLLASGSVSAGVTTAQIQQALQNYCVPTASSATCNSVWEAHFWKGKSTVGTSSTISNDRCRCADSEYMQYDPQQRKCVIVCPAGYYAADVTTTGGCPSGSYGKRISWDSDPQNH
ncbi:MAG: hypothetical protein IJ638_03670 [Alphaproteobacteria bacterium]|nr:hypothetical protein [Alphaproteobacteria bacterium]